MVRRYLIPLLLVATTVGVFYRVHDYGFVWDDNINVYENPYLNPVTPGRVLHFWREPYAGLYIPLTYSVWAAVARLATHRTTDKGKLILNPRPFHITNLFLHVLSMMVVFAILRLLVRDDWAACGGAFLFGLHPVQVEPVAWVTGMKDVLSGFFSLVAVWQYLAYAVAPPISAGGVADERLRTSAERGGAWGLRRRAFHYALATLAFALALLAKPTAVVVPVVVWLLDNRVVRRSVRQSAAALVGWIAMAVPVIVMTRLAQPAGVIRFVTPLWARPLVASDALAFYLYKLALPVWLGPDYGRSPEWVLQQGWIYLAWIVPCGLVVTLWLWRDRRPWLVASAGIFVAGVLPVLGLMPFSFQYVSTVGDRYLYLSMLGPALALAWLLSRHRGRLLPAACALTLGLLGIGSTLQARVWHDSESLWQYALSVNPASSTVHYNLALALRDRGVLEGAIQHYRRAVEIDPAAADAHNNLGDALSQLGELDEAIQHYRRALAIEPKAADVHYNLGNALTRLGELDGAIRHYRRAVEIDPTAADARERLGDVLARRGELDAAIRQYRAALKLARDNAGIYFKVGSALAKLGRLGEATELLQRAVKMKPDFAEAYHNLGRVKAAQGDLDKAIDYFRRALLIRPEFAEAHESLGRALTQQDKKDEAVKHYSEALRILKGH